MGLATLGIAVNTWQVVRAEGDLRRMSDLAAADLANWRDRRLQEVAPASVNREMVPISGVKTVARKELAITRYP